MANSSNVMLIILFCEFLPHKINGVFSNSSHCISSSTLTSAPYKFRQSVAITRKLFPDNYIPSKLAEFDEDIEEDYEEPNCEGESFEVLHSLPSNYTIFSTH